jgi:hypothetical protein
VKPVALALAVALTSGGCIQHPVATIASATTVIGFGGCAIDEVKIGDCVLIGAISGVFFGGLAWLLYHYTDSNAHELKMEDESIGSNGALKLHTFTPPPPVPLAAPAPADAGIPEAPPPTPPADAAPVAPDQPPAP